MNLSQEGLKEAVDGIDEGLVGAKTQIEGDGFAPLGENAIAESIEDPHIGTTKAVNGLFDIADNGEVTALGEGFEEFCLDGVGILKFID